MVNQVTRRVPKSQAKNSSGLPSGRKLKSGKKGSKNNNELNGFNVVGEHQVDIRDTGMVGQGVIATTDEDTDDDGGAAGQLAEVEYGGF